MRVAVGADNRGLAMREEVIRVVQQLGHEVEQTPKPEEQTPDYPEVAATVALQVQQGKAERGILVARTGMGMCIVANKFAGIRAAVCHDEFMAEMSRHYLDLNILCLPADLLGRQHVEKLIETWLKTPFEGGRHAQRVERIAEIEREAAHPSNPPDGGSNG